MRAAVTPALRLIVALDAIHAAHPQAIRQLTLDGIDLPNRRIILDGIARPLDELTHEALRDHLAERRQLWPHIANPHALISRLTATGVEPVSTNYLKQYLLLRHQVRLEPGDSRQPAVHERGFVSRDLTPNTVTVGPDGSCRSVDLEIAAVPGALIPPHRALPGQCLGRGSPGPRFAGSGAPAVVTRSAPRASPVTACPGRGRACA
ncbi:hypothetical protein AB0C33_13650 [Nonomuraea sp. NPDC048881]|uniref:hypothetical protein n=1 Tax=Nonomuraea sp. NPDC048881 TaxID=3155030 RepID=UPI0033D2911B